MTVSSLTLECWHLAIKFSVDSRAAQDDKCSPARSLRAQLLEHWVQLGKATGPVVDAAKVRGWLGPPWMWERMQGGAAQLLLPVHIQFACWL